MNALRWVRSNFLIPIAMVSTSATVALVYQASEINAQQYKTLTATYQDGTARYRAFLENAAEQNTISRREFQSLLRNFWTDADMLNVDTLPPGMVLQGAKN